jgi:NAD(P)-dependent dehydrogenase (short-subunit alcohol dehydrogenase family)
VYAILGATGGLGSELARELASQGARLVLAARDRTALQTLCSELDAEPFPITDGSDFGEVQACLETAAIAFGRLDGVVNCMGSLLLKPAHLTTREEWDAVVAANLTSAFATVRSAANVMSEGGSVVVVSSAAARVGLRNHEAIAAAKAGVIGLAQSAAATYARQNLRINAVAPGLVRTPMTRRITSNEAALAKSTSMHPLNRAGEASDVASLIVWLLDARQSWVTGQCFGVDGGLATVRSA